MHYFPEIFAIKEYAFDKQWKWHKYSGKLDVCGVVLVLVGWVGLGVIWRGALWVFGLLIVESFNQSKAIASKKQNSYGSNDLV